MRINFILICFALLILGNSKSEAQVTFSEHIAPIIYNHCTSCHRTGEIAPFPLTNYNEVAEWADMIKYVTGIKYMPPWKPDPQYQRYLQENFLSEDEIQKISDWVDQGTPQGNTALEPALPVYPGGSQVGVPDLTLSFAQSYNHVGNNVDEYRFFVLPTGLTQDKDLVALELRPGNKNIVHHTLIWQDTTGQSALDDAATPEYGYTQGDGGLENQLPGYVPGVRPIVLTNGFAQKLYAGADLKLQMHYAPVAADEADSTTVNLFFADQPATRFLQSYIMLPLPPILTNGPFVIPANEVREFHGALPVPFDVSLFSIAPHMHKLGTHWKVYAVKPDGDTINLISINNWDFNWQGGYQFKHLIHVPAGSVIHALAGYDNTVNNPLNPNDPPQLITWGEGTSDEMYYLPLSYLFYQPGDELIEFEDPLTTGLNLYSVKDKLYPVSPNPSAGDVKFGYSLETSGEISISLYTMQGSKIQTMMSNKYHLPGLHSSQLSVSDLSAGVYFLEFTKGNVRQVEKVVVVK